MKITAQPTMVPNMGQGETAVTVRCADDNDQELAMFNVLLESSVAGTDGLFQVYARRLDSASKAAANSIGSGDGKEAALSAALSQLAHELLSPVENQETTAT